MRAFSAPTASELHSDDMSLTTLVRFRPETVKIDIFANESGNYATARAMGLQVGAGALIYGHIDRVRHAGGLRTGLRQDFFDHFARISVTIGIFTN